MVGASALAGDVEYSDGAVSSAQVAVKHIVPVNGKSRDGPRPIDAKGVGALERTCARVGGAECGDGAVGSAHETVIHIARVKVESHDRTSQVNGVSEGSLVGACACARSIECDDGEPEGRVANIQDAIAQTAYQQAR